MPYIYYLVIKQVSLSPELELLRQVHTILKTITKVITLQKHYKSNLILLHLQCEDISTVQNSVKTVKNACIWPHYCGMTAKFIHN